MATKRIKAYENALERLSLLNTGSSHEERSTQESEFIKAYETYEKHVSQEVRDTLKENRFLKTIYCNIRREESF